MTTSFDSWTCHASLISKPRRLRMRRAFTLYGVPSMIT